MRTGQIINRLRDEYLTLMSAVGTEASRILSEKTFIAGGAIASLVLDEEPKDFDVWFHDIEAWNAVITAMPMAPDRTSKYSFTYTVNGRVFQLVRSRLGSPEKVTKTFDFRHTQAYFDPLGLRLVADEEFIKAKQLVFVRGNLCHPVNTVQRVLKLARRGYSINNQTIADLMNEVGEIYQMRREDSGEEADVFHPGWGGGGEEDSR